MKAMYIIINSDGEYFVELSRQNKVVITKDIAKATSMDWSDAQELLPLIELYSGKIAVTEAV